ncbi:hypothetical protein ACP275_12G050500 [Erythranthe tilingii]
MDSNCYGGFTDLLTGDISVYEESSTINSTINIENTTEGDFSNKQKRSTNFTRRGCLYCFGMDKFVINCGQQVCTEQSIKQRWHDINAKCAKYISCLKQIENMHQSGQTDHGRLEEARKMYVATNKHQFKFEHCLDLLKHERKWLVACERNKQGTTSFDNLDGVSIPLED